MRFACAPSSPGGAVQMDRDTSSTQPVNCTIRGMSIEDSVTVSAAEFRRNVGLYQDIALTKPVTITKNGREWTVLLSAQEYARLKRRDRRVIAAGQLSGRQVDAARNARISDRFADLDKEIKD